MELKKLTKSDLDILNSMRNVVDGIARMYGEYTEVVLHSLDAELPKIIKIANGHVTERDEGAPITNLALMKLKEGKDVSDSYLTKTNCGKTLHSITTIVRNPKNKPIGLLCINVDMGAPVHSFLRAILPPNGDCCNETPSPETFARNIDETIESTIDTVKEEVWSNDAISPSKRNREVVTRLHGLGIFKIKDAVLTVANQLGISRDTIYLYLRELG
ncbi:helix-turn-helix transcriptional regulator [Vibrio sp. LaRot3]|uniref:helix-turn-helix transcriptional regulator n=1 Tax=Vibrio sp. LaRot3 TaxID=2998829 RepID=UPI0022CDF3B2|nr:PAS domain-containing protein [Vibrio sp. LaRot3]MDA0147143.1 PAS domain-containing protein [Vibrio sp. LaRot3]